MRLKGTQSSQVEIEVNPRIALQAAADSIFKKLGLQPGSYVNDRDAIVVDCIEYGKFRRVIVTAFPSEDQKAVIAAVETLMTLGSNCGAFD